MVHLEIEKPFSTSDPRFLGNAAGICPKKMPFFQYPPHQVFGSRGLRGQSQTPRRSKLQRLNVDQRRELVTLAAFCWWKIQPILMVRTVPGKKLDNMTFPAGLLSLTFWTQFQSEVGQLKDFVLLGLSHSQHLGLYIVYSAYLATHTLPFPFPSFIHLCLSEGTLQWPRTATFWEVNGY